MRLRRWVRSRGRSSGAKRDRNKFPSGETDGDRQIKAPRSLISFFWVVEGGSGWEVEQAQGYPRETGPVLDSKLRRRH